MKTALALIAAMAATPLAADHGEGPVPQEEIQELCTLHGELAELMLDLWFNGATYDDIAPPVEEQNTLTGWIARQIRDEPRYDYISTVPQLQPRYIQRFRREVERECYSIDWE